MINKILKMKNSNPIKFRVTYLVPMILIVLSASCKKDATVVPTTTATTITSVSTDASTLSDVQPLTCQLPDTVNIADLPSAVSTYLSANYVGYTTQFVYAIKSNGTLTGYLANLLNGTQHTAVRFDATGNFVKALNLPMHVDVEFAVFQTDTIPISTLPIALQAYLTTNNTYSLQKAFMETDSSYTLVATQAGNAYALLYSNASPTVLSIINLGAIDFSTPNPDMSTLPSTITDYINQNYSGAAIERIMAGTCSGGSNGYTVIFKKDSAQYAAEFDSTGIFTEVLQEK
jgi:hypothetical protein